MRVYIDTLLVIRGTFELTDLTNATEVNLFTKSIVENQSIYVHGRLVASNSKRDAPNQSFRLDYKIIHFGKNEYSVVGQRFSKTHQWDEPNTDPGLVQTIFPSLQWIVSSDSAIDKATRCNRYKSFGRRITTNDNKNSN